MAPVSRSHRLARSSILLLLLLVLGSCGDWRPADRPAPGLALDDLPGYVVDADPALTLGLDPPSEEYVFVNLIAGGIVDDSLVVVADGILNRAAVYGFDGGFRRWIVREGEGPGEVGSIRDAGVLPDGTLWVHDLVNLLLLRVDAHGTIVSQTRMALDDPAAIVRTEVIGPGADGSWWLRRDDGVSDQEPGTLFRVPTELLRLDRHGNIETIWAGDGDLAMTADAREMFLEGTPANRTTILSAPYFPRLHVEPTGGGVLVAWSDSGWVDHIAADGRRRRIGAIPTARVPVAEEEPPEGAPPGLEVAYRQDRYYPEISGLLLDLEGDVWILQAPRMSREDRERSAAPTLLYHISGDPVRYISSPTPGLGTPLGGESILAAQRHDETGEQFVTLHRLRPLEGAPSERPKLR